MEVAAVYVLDRDVGVPACTTPDATDIIPVIKLFFKLFDIIFNKAGWLISIIFEPIRNRNNDCYGYKLTNDRDSLYMTIMLKSTGFLFTIWFSDAENIFTRT